MLGIRFALGAAAIGMLLAAVGAGASGARKPHGNNFFSNCRFSHTANDDPIVFPGKPGWSHPHTFFGNVSTDARSTLATLRAAPTTCTPRADRAAYWVPTLLQNGREVRPAKAQLYYVVRGYRDMHAFPAGLRMIAGNSRAQTPQSKRVTYWDCAGRAEVKSKPSSTVPARCGVREGKVLARLAGSSHATMMRVRTPTSLELHVNFPDCWDGKHLDSADHRSHMAYSRQLVCPPSHPVKVPLIRLMVRYPIRSGKGVMLASGGQLSGHADFFNAWNEDALRKLVDACFHDRPCNDPRARPR
jgi:Domain of unknown function (DUF1996)